jgi:transcriptional regulator with PAS, ATPase and Fis domain
MTLAPETLKTLIAYSWPGNVRELENTIRFIANIADQEVITPDYLPQVFLYAGKNSQSEPAGPAVKLDDGIKLKDMTHATEKEAIIAALDRFGRNVPGKKAAAKYLGISLTTLYARINTFNIH